MSDPDLRPPRPSSRPWAIAIAAVVVAAAAFLAWRQWFAPPPAQPPAAPAAAQAPESEAAPAQEPPAGPAHPIEPVPVPAPLPALAASDAAVQAALSELVDRARLLRFVQPDGLVRRAVATVDNLPRAHAPSRLWPVHPLAPRFGVEGEGDALHIAPANAARYGPLVQFVEQVDPARAAALYRRFYPLFQQAYEELGYPGRYFNDRAVAAIDDLLQAPEPQAPVALRLVEIKGSEPAAQPWVRYEYADPALERLSAGQKILVRMGPAHARALKAWLGRLRAEIARGAPAGR